MFEALSISTPNLRCRSNEQGTLRAPDRAVCAPGYGKTAVATPAFTMPSFLQVIGIGDQPITYSRPLVLKTLSAPAP